MTKIALCILLTATLLAASLHTAPAHAAQSLIHMKADEAASGKGKPLRMELREIERNAHRSVVDVRFQSGGSVSSSLFVMKGLCAIAADRGAAYFRKVSEVPQTHGTRYVIAYSDRAAGPELGPVAGKGSNANAEVLSVEQFCKVLGFGTL